MNVTELYIAGAQELHAEHQAKEAEKRGTWRGGSSGCVVLGGNTVGTCGRLAILRSLGIEVSEEDGASSKQLMFANGYMNEDDWLSKLTLSWKGKILREEEIPVVWQTSKGTSVTGRPDIVLCDEAGKPRHGIELKQISSLWTARDVGAKLSPKTPHLVQAGHYAWKLGISYSLLYTSRANFAVANMGWVQKLFPEQRDVVGSVIEDRFKWKTTFDKRTNKEVTYLKDMLPFIQEFEIAWLSDQLVYRPLFPGVPGGNWTNTIITKGGVEAYYEMLDSGRLPPPPSNLDAEGKELSFDLCTYCELNELCKGNKISSLDKWTKEAVAFLSGAVATKKN